ncbi:PAS domain S-box protein [Candidatus Woesearchaeota archaeon]|nr:PAS domain S-box protein [Candidatus Woesearchaeota archaeon]
MNTIKNKNSDKHNLKHEEKNKVLNSFEVYKRLFDEALDAILIADAKTGIILDCNLAACRLVEREKSELIGKHQRIIHPPEEIKGRFSRTFEQHLKEKEGKILETQVITKKGKIKNVAIKANVFELKGKKLIQGMFRDISDRKKAQEAISKAYKTQSDIIENAPFGVFTVNKKGVVDYANPTMLMISGDKREVFIRINVFKLPTYVELGLAGKIRNCFKGKPFFIGPLTYTSYYSKKRTVRNFTGLPMKNEKGVVEKVMIFVEDITKTKEAEETLKKSEARLRDILDHLQTGVIIIDPETRKIVYVNSLAIQMIGLPKEKILGKICHKFICPAERNKCPILDLGQRVDNSERILLNVKGEKIPILKTTVPMVLEGKKRLIESFVDITGRKKIEDELKKRTEELERFNKLAVGRELKMVKLKKRIKELEGKVKKNKNKTGVKE